ncbi:MAG: hypothetical protein DRI36_01200, partial [Caldiserica bacterium]
MQLDGPGLTNWWDENWKYRRKITINNTGSTLNDYQVFIATTEFGSAWSDIKSKAQSDMDDFRFVHSSGGVLNYWIEPDTNNPKGFWVKVSTVTGNGNTDIWMYYGNVSAFQGSNINELYIEGLHHWIAGLPSGSYLINPDGPGECEPFVAYCDTRTLGGYAGWTVIFKSDDPEKWKTDFGTPGQDEWGHDVSNIDWPMCYLNLERVSTGENITIEISSSILYSAAWVNPPYHWNGTKYYAWNAYHLGISNDQPCPTSPEGYIIVGANDVVNNNDKRSWGFGHRGWIDDVQGWGWDSWQLGATIFQISVRGSRVSPEPTISSIGSEEGKYYSSGNYKSNVLDTGADGTKIIEVSWNPTTQPA